MCLWKQLEQEEKKFYVCPKQSTTAYIYCVQSSDELPASSLDTKACLCHQNNSGLWTNSLLGPFFAALLKSTGVNIRFRKKGKI